MFQNIRPLAVIFAHSSRTYLHTLEHPTSCASLKERSHTAAQLSLYEANNGLNVEKWMADNLMLANTSHAGG